MGDGDKKSWKVELINDQATHANGTTVSFDNGQVTDIDQLPPNLSVHDIKDLVKSAEKAFKIARDNRPRKMTLSLKK